MEPKKFLRNPNPLHDASQDALRKELCIKEVEHEIRRLRTVAEIKKKYLDKIDREIFDMIEHQYHGDRIDAEKQRWRDLSGTEESTSKEIWAKKSEFFSSEKHLLPLESSKPNRNPRPIYNNNVRPRPRQNYYFENENRPNRYNNRATFRRPRQIQRYTYIDSGFNRRPKRPADWNVGPLYNERFRPYNDRQNWRLRPNLNRSNILNEDMEESQINETHLHNSNSFLG